MIKKSILFVCLGNICRSPACEGFAKKHFGNYLDVDSAGIENYHVGQPPDSRSIKVCKNHGIDISSHRARKIRKNDWDQFDVIVALDQSVLQSLQHKKPKNSKAKLVLFSNGVPDPWYGGNSAFDSMYSQIERDMTPFLKQLKLIPNEEQKNEL